MNLEKPLYTFNAICGAKGDKNALRIVGPCPDYALIRSWLGQCNKEHRECQILGSTENLKIITLIDVQNQRLVRYKPGLQYVALSYVWGGAPVPERIPGRPFELPNNISKTINHAMVVAENIGIPFLWADAVCIDQDKVEEKNQQLPLMNYIYEHASATIIALGDHANFGLPGVQGGPERLMQLVAEFGPLQLMARNPLLSSQIQSSAWSKRGWTYQEGLFSRRCIYFSQHQKIRPLQSLSPGRTALIPMRLIFLETHCCNPTFTQEAMSWVTWTFSLHTSMNIALEKSRMERTP
ncbi:HET-domain-containing protein [Paraphaeosphaeria sporulosa]|uniref:HET-domain-containing protein n=1 Tax=Paraphaeosphaeria sporulosa TaxID=1460663 RepID=A0A177CGH6_9PLEO|nr:HET-domain-containing protein [Paraphaeosphaeria sporulosa]OAG06466.1 HET-domain-containing protein [Paraphaeosphaeria sporulosa]